MSVFPRLSRPSAAASSLLGNAGRVGLTRFAVVTGLFGVGVAGAMGVLMGRVAQLQIAPEAPLVEHIEPRTTKRPEPPVRGDILDRRGRVLATTTLGERVIFDPVAFLERTKPEDMDAKIVRLADAMGLPADEVGSWIIWGIERNKARAAALPEPPPPRNRGKHLVATKDATAPVAPAQPAKPDIAAAPVDTVTRKPIRYIPIGGLLTEEQGRAVATLRISGVQLEKRQRREFVGGSEIASIVGKVGFDDTGKMGAEMLLDNQLQGTEGGIRFVRDARGQPLWIDPGQVRAPVPGKDIRLSFDLELQRIVDEEINRGVNDANAAGGRILLVDPATGEVLAMQDIIRDLPEAAEYPWVPVPPPRKRGEAAPPAVREPDLLSVQRRFRTIKPDPARLVHPALGRNRVIEDVYEPGSTFKPFIWSTITELGLARPEEIIDTEGGHWSTAYGRKIEDVTKRQQMTWAEVLINSSNIGMIKVSERLTYAQMRDAVVRFGFGRPTGVGVPGRPIPGEGEGIVTAMGKWSKYSQTSVAYGHEIAVTPVQMARAFSAFARTGERAGTLPRLRMTAAEQEEGPGVEYRVLPPHIAQLTRAVLSGVTDNVEAKMEKPEGGWRYRIFGKSGTAEIPLGAAPKGFRRPRGSTGYFDNQFNSSFIAGGPIELPRLVVVVVIDDPGPRPGPRSLRYGSATAGPVARRVLERALTYLGTPPSPVPEAPAAPTLKVQ
jgi:cell division protein FtsI/penicillin-binding protein 2